MAVATRCGHLNVIEKLIEYDSGNFEKRKLTVPRLKPETSVLLNQHLSHNLSYSALLDGGLTKWSTCLLGGEGWG